MCLTEVRGEMLIENKDLKNYLFLQPLLYLSVKSVTDKNQKPAFLGETDLFF